MTFRSALAPPRQPYSILRYRHRAEKYTILLDVSKLKETDVRTNLIVVHKVKPWDGMEE